jgi:DNA-binding MarR family transcriptional regulator
MPRIDRKALEVAKSESLGQVLFKCARLLNERALERVAKTHGGPALRPAHTSLLPHITFEGVRLTELAHKLGVTKQAVSQLVATMADMGVVEYAPDPSDARAKLVRFTAKGAQSIAQGLTLLRTIEAEIESEIGTRTMGDLKRGLDAMLAVLEAQSAASSR